MQHENDPILSSTSVTKYFGDQVAVDNITVNIDTSALGLLGPNGSGKTTLIKMMLGLLKPTRGTIKLGVPIGRVRVVPDQPVLPDFLTVDQWIELIEKMHGPNHLEIDVQTIFQLNGHWKLGNLSAGQKRKAALMPIFFGKPELIILDEPTNFLDIVSREQILQLLRTYLSQINCKLILATHRINEMRIFCQDVMVLKSGQVVRTVKLNKSIPKSYTLVVNENEVFEDLLNRYSITYRVEQEFQGEVFRITPHDQLWDLIAEYNKLGHAIINFETNDVLKHTIEELLT